MSSTELRRASSASVELRQVPKSFSDHLLAPPSSAEHRRAIMSTVHLHWYPGSACGFAIFLLHHWFHLETRTPKNWAIYSLMNSYLELRNFRELNTRPLSIMLDCYFRLVAQVGSSTSNTLSKKFGACSLIHKNYFWVISALILFLQENAITKTVDLLTSLCRFSDMTMLIYWHYNVDLVTLPRWFLFLMNFKENKNEYEFQKLLLHMHHNQSIPMI